MFIDMFSLPGFILYQPETMSVEGKVKSLNALARNFRRLGKDGIRHIAETKYGSSFSESISIVADSLAEIIKKVDEPPAVRLASVAVMRAISSLSFEAYTIVLDRFEDIKLAASDDPHVRQQVAEYWAELHGLEQEDEPIRSFPEMAGVAFAYIC